MTHEGHIGLLQQFVKNMGSSYALSSFSKIPCLYRLMTDGGMEDEQAKQSIVLSSMEGWVFDIENIAEKGFAAAAPRSMIFDMMRIAACLLCLACLTELLHVRAGSMWSCCGTSAARSLGFRQSGDYVNERLM